MVIIGHAGNDDQIHVSDMFMRVTMPVMFRDIHDNGKDNAHDDIVGNNENNDVFWNYEYCLSGIKVMFDNIHGNPYCYYELYGKCS